MFEETVCFREEPLFSVSVFLLCYSLDFFIRKQPDSLQLFKRWYFVL